MTIVLRLDPTRCDAQGVCAELLPEWIAYDDWGYPLVCRDAIPDRLLGHARRAVNACPRAALSLVEEH